MTTYLSVNINKIATIRNSRGENMPNLVQTALDCERYGAQGITVHPRPDERHIRYSDVIELKKAIKTPLNIEGYPSEKFLKLIKETKPEQVTLVPDEENQITSNQGWDTLIYKQKLKDWVEEIQSIGAKVSIFINPQPQMVEGAKETKTDRIELYTGPYAQWYERDSIKAINPYIETANLATQMDIEINAGHDLNLNNLSFFKNHIAHLNEVSIGHALICDALYFGLENTIQMYLKELKSN